VTWTLEFSEVGGKLIGRVTYDGSTVKADDGLGSLIDPDESPEDTLKRYDGWSNGYYSSRRV
jgi:hypothetical protein